MSKESLLDLGSMQVNRDIAARQYWRRRMEGLEPLSCFIGEEGMGQAMGQEEAGPMRVYRLTAAAETDALLRAVAPSAKARHLVLLAAVGVLLHKYGSCTDVVVFTPEGGLPEGAGCEGRLLPVRLRQEEGMSFREMLTRLREELPEDLRHGSYPLEKKLGIKAGELVDWSPVGFRLKELQPGSSLATLPAGLVFHGNTEGPLSLEIEYVANRYEPSYIGQVAKLYMELLYRLLSDKDRALGEIELIGEEEKQLILEEFNATDRPFARDKTIMDLFSARATVARDRMAIRCGEQDLSYGDLEEGSGRVAFWLGERFEKGTVIGVELDRSLELMVAVFGILKAGCVYLPLSRQYPADRNGYMLEDSGARLLVTDRQVVEGPVGVVCCRVTPAGAITLVETAIPKGANVSSDSATAPGRGSTEPQAGSLAVTRSATETSGTASMRKTLSVGEQRPGPEDLAYIIYTSGSTGRPKGVMIRHRSLMNRLNWMQEQYVLTAEDRVLQKTPLVFDVSIWELFWSSLQGARLVLAPPGWEKDPEALGRLIASEKITVLHFVPPMLQAFLQYQSSTGQTSSLSGLRAVFCSGEELKTADARLFRSCCPQAELHNLYGPTEATVDVSYYAVFAGDKDGAALLPRRIPIGKPIDNTRLYILNKAGHLQPVGVAGELYIGGENLSVGYVNRPDLTGDRFVEDPFRSGDRLYRTGDLARWQGDGNIEFLGRIDQQVKIRGNRVELGEIEEALTEIDGIRQAIVLTRESSGGVQVVGFVRVSAGEGRSGEERSGEEGGQLGEVPSEGELRKILALRLPDYMVPDRIVRVSEIPVTVNGKWDRRALLGLVRELAADYAAPETALQQALSVQWSKVLGREGLGLRDGFFRSGGDSIGAVRLLGAINSEWVVGLSMSDLLSHDTIGSMSELLEERLLSGASQSREQEIGEEVAAFDRSYREGHGGQLSPGSESSLDGESSPGGQSSPGEIEAAYPMSDIETGMCFIHLSNPEEILYFEQNLIPIGYAELDMELLRRSVELLMEKHSILRTSFDLGSYAHVVYRKLLPDLSYRDLSDRSREQQEEEIGNYLEASRARHFDISRAPLWRMRVYRLRGDYHLLVFEAHHAILDGWSHASLITEMNNIYGELLRDGSYRPAGLEVSYKDHIIGELLRKRDSGMREFWNRELSGYRKLDLGRAMGKGGSTAISSVEKRPYSIRKTYSSGLLQGIERVSRERGMAVKHLFFAAYVYALKMLTRENDIVVGLVSFSRPLKKDGDKLLGCFLNTVPVRIVLGAGSTWDGYLRQVEEKLQEVGRYDGLSFFEISRSIGEKVENVNPVFDTLFNFINFHIIEELQLAGTVSGNQEVKIDNFLRDESLFSVSIHANEQGIKAKYDYTSSFMDEDTFQRFLGYYEQILHLVAENDAMVINNPIDLIPPSERHLLLEGYNATQLSYDRQATIVSLFAQQAERTPGKTAVSCEGRSLSYRELDDRSERLARHLRDHCLRDRHVRDNGLEDGRLQDGQSQDLSGPGGAQLVGIMMDRSEQLLVGLLGILKAGAAYVPLDPTYPGERIAYMLQDSGAQVLVTDRVPEEGLGYGGTVVVLEEVLGQACVFPPASSSAPSSGSSLKDAPGQSAGPLGPPLSGPMSSDLCYLIYTSGSTGRPKGVMITHGNVVNFFAGMDARLPVGEADRLLAVTSTSFDISVLELFWTLCRGVEVVLHPSDIGLNNLDRYVAGGGGQGPDFSLFFFSSYNGGEESDKYRLLLESVKYADESGFKAVWVPERHFHEFGGLYPNPSVIGAALSMVTKRLSIRSGSVVSPLHDAIRIAEEWSVVDNLSGGRVGLSFASGWNPDDFLLSPEHYKDRQHRMYGQLEEVRRLWKGEGVRRTNGVGQEVEVRIFPRPVQEELPVWVTSAGSEETFRSAGRVGANLLTHLLGQDLEMLSKNIEVYRSSRKAAGYDGGKVTLMLHTYIGEELGAVEELVEGPFTEYLLSSIGLSKAIFEEAGFRMEDMPEEVRSKVLRNAFLRYYKTGSLIGTLSSCGRMVEDLKGIGVDEIACLVDFGIGEKEVLAGLKRLRELKDRYAVIEAVDMEGTAGMERGVVQGRGKEAAGAGGVTLLQSTPSFLRMVEEGGGSRRFLGSLRALLIGGEALPATLVRRLREQGDMEIYNMYGPTETTIWSSMEKVEGAGGQISIGRPLANTQVYILDAYRGLVPPGVVGELYIGGEGLSRGYWNRAELTEDRFIAHPFRSGERLYRTGDLARWLPEGKLEYMGRIDQQVKLRGYRIELGEIESCLLQEPEVREAVVVARSLMIPGMDGRQGKRDAGKAAKDGREDATEDKVLVGYIVTEGPVDTGLLRKRVSEQLPHYMVPAQIVRLEALPLTLNGKLDRMALPDPVAEGGSDHVGPNGTTQERLVAIWSEVLRIDKDSISVHRSFFDLGGHSLKAAFLLNAILKEFNVAVPLHIIFKHSDIISLGNYIDEAERGRFRAIEPAPAGDYYPLSSAQKRLYFLYQLDKSSLAYNTPYVMRLQGAVNKLRLEEACQQLILRQESLRTSFILVNGEVVQQVTPQTDFKIESYYTNGADLQKSIASFIRPFDLEQAPLLRVGFIELSAEESLLLVDMHHIISDGVSQGLIIGDFMALYQGEELTPLRLHYKDFAVWQQSGEQQKRIGQARSFWLSEFQEEVPVLELPADYPRPLIKNYAGASLDFILGGEEAKGLQELAESEGCTLFMVLLSAYSILLSRLSNQEDIVTGTPIAGRGHTDVEKMIGIFVNTLPIRHRVQGDWRYRDFLSAVKAKTLACLDHQDYPYESLIESLNLRRDASRNPLFDAAFFMQNFEEAELSIPGLTLRPYEGVYSQVSKFDLTLTAQEREGRIGLKLEYATSLFTAATIERFIACFRQIVTELVSKPDQRLFELNILPPSERHLLLEGYNATQLSYDRQATIVSLFAQQAERTPEKTAVSCEGRSLNYRELDDRSERLARHLRDHCLRDRHVRDNGLEDGHLQDGQSQDLSGPGGAQLVGIMMARSEQLLVGLLGILKAGAAYVPLDPTYPGERIAYMLQDSGAQVLVTDRVPEEGLGYGGTVVVLEEVLGQACAFPPASSSAPSSGSSLKDAPGQSAGPLGPPLSGPMSSDLCYLIYTSGSTGRPKGVMITHGNVVNFFAGMDARLPVGEADRLLAVTSTSFDISVLELFWTLCRGVEVVLHPSDIGLNGLDRYIPDVDPEGAMNLISGEERDGVYNGGQPVTLLQSTPSFLRMVEEGGGSRRFLGSLRALLIGGEALPATLVRRLREQGDMEIYNMYGPTETTIWSSMEKVEGAGGQISIGRPLANTQVYILDAYRGLVPPGVVGELYIGGEGLSRGYWNRAELTEDRFIAHPFRSGERLYRTGDLARWLPEGKLEYMGRIDQQVKLRGYRIELGEIESCLLQEPEVREAVVVPRSLMTPGMDGRQGKRDAGKAAKDGREDATEDKVLVGYIVTEGPVDTGLLRKRLSEQLPHYMVPAQIVRLEALPLTLNGKLDRKALPDPVGASAPDHIAPRGATEEQLAAIWSEVLRIDKDSISVNHSFFDLGGHSLKVGLLLNTIFKELHIEIPLIEIFRSDTIADISDYIENKRWAAKRASPEFLLHPSGEEIILD